MDREHILNVVVKHLRYNVDALEDVEISASKSMADYGASSLDIIEVVASSMRELRIKVATTELSRLKNIGELVDLLVATRMSAEQTSP